MNEPYELDICECGHGRYHHRPECGYRSAFGPLCSCSIFKAPKEEA